MTNNKRILLVDDNIDHPLLTKLILEKRGYEVKTLRGAQDILQTVRSYKPRLIFMDHIMPEIDGVTATKWLKSDAGCLDVPVVYFTVRNDIVELAAKAGADDGLCKPFIASDLLRKLEAYF